MMVAAVKLITKSQIFLSKFSTDSPWLAWLPWLAQRGENFSKEETPNTSFEMGPRENVDKKVGGCIDNLKCQLHQLIPLHSQSAVDSLLEFQKLRVIVFTSQGR